MDTQKRTDVQQMTTTMVTPAVMPSIMPAISSAVFTPPSNGITGGYTGGDVTILRAMTAFAAIAWYNALELIVLIFLRFNKYEGLYFWSLLVTSLAILVYETGAWGNMNNIASNPLIFETLQNVGWIFMVIGQSIVLYSRLHLITFDQRILKFVLALIVFNAFVLYIPTTTLNYGCVIYLTPVWINGYNIMERTQMTIFSVQEFIISGIYLWEVRRFIGDWEEGTRKLMYELVAVNIALILLDVALLTVEFENLYEIETTLKGAVYSIKLKLEFGVLSKLVSVMENRKSLRKVDNSAENIDLRKYSSAQVANRWFSDPVEKRSYSDRLRSSQSLSSLPGSEHIERSNPANTSLRSFALVRPSIPSVLPEVQRESTYEDLYPGRLNVE